MSDDIVLPSGEVLFASSVTNPEQAFDFQMLRLAWLPIAYGPAGNASPAIMRAADAYKQKWAFR